MPEQRSGYARVGKKGDLTVYVTYVQFHTNDPVQNAMYIRNENRPNTDGGCRAVLICENELWLYRPEDRDRGRHHRYEDMSGYLSNKAIALYGFDTREYRHRILDAILDYAPCVIEQKPPPEETMAEYHARLRSQGIIVKVNGRTMN